MSGQRHHGYLVPGFFGFANLGELKYFGRVPDFLVAEAAARLVDIDVHVASDRVSAITWTSSATSATRRTDRRTSTG